MILDAGALIAVDRNDRAVIARLRAAVEGDDELKTHPMVVAQAWRGVRRQATLARLLRNVVVVSIDSDLGRRCGELLGKAGTSDPIDAAVVLIAAHGDTIVTSDPDDIRHLARIARRRVMVVGC
jgi:predicted nucleic acid-binding protein